LALLLTPKEHFAFARTQLVHARMCENWMGLSEIDAAPASRLASALSSSARIKPATGASAGISMPRALIVD
jgi:hypothetical protein